MKRTWSFYDQRTGALTGKRYSTRNDADLVSNTPPGCLPIEGAFDHLSKRIVDGKVVDWQPPQPDSDHEWHAESERWVKRSDVLEREARIRRALARISELEQRQARIDREIRLRPNEVTDGKTPIQRLADLDAEISQLRRTVNGETETTVP